MTDQLERDLIALFEDRAAQAKVPPVPMDLFASPTADPRWTRRRTLALGLAAAAAVAAVAVPIGLANRGDDPAPPTKDPEVPHGISVPYLLDGELHAGDLTIPTTASALQVTGSQLLVTSIDEDGGGVSWERLVGDRLEDLPFLDGVFGATVTGNGALAAAPVGSDATTSVRIWDVASGAVVDTIPLADQPSGEEPWLWGFDGEGRLYWQDGVTQRMRTTAGDVVTLRTGELRFAGLSPGGIVLRRGSERTAKLGIASDSGAVQESGEVPVSTTVAWRNSGLMAYQAPASGLVSVYDVASGKRTPITVDDAFFLTPVGWSGDEVVVVAQDVGPQRVVAVDPTTGLQRLVLEFAVDDPAVFPSLGGTGAL
ncbi:hypothetical protein CFH99_14425 [Nocardioides aromaticivorans]|uniref:WD40 repeat domain-containing protein n=1 Tax=Nocardioides aromaticivorans TaxID=200618 RepID=A0ABX7PM86_9ACTN|nr:hypothetical protein [Nocardioides aromaticivorans]QSR26822.1 hypothetical protein CFH99_14425 [Nocardioides aromaticivorans]